MKTIIPEKPMKKSPGYPLDIKAAEIDRRFRKVLGEFESPSVPLRLKVTGQVELKGGIIRQRLEYDVDKGERVSAYHLFKKGLPENAPGVLSIHGHGGEGIFPVGKAFHCHPVKDDPIQYSYLAALAGFRVLAPDALCFGERQPKWGYATKFYDEIAAHEELACQGKSLAWKSVWDNSRALEVLESRGCKSMGVIGWSGGSTQAYILASVNKKVQASVCFFSFMTLRHQFNQYRLCHCLYHYIPGMMKAGIDWDQVVSLIPPRKIFMAWGAKDEGTPEPMYKAFCDAIRKRDKKSLTVFEELERGHEITMPMLENALGFLKREIHFSSSL
jgi:dienelactone hydrolase